MTNQKNGGGSNDPPREAPQAPHLVEFTPEPEPGDPRLERLVDQAPGLTGQGFVTADVFFEGFKSSQEMTGYFLGLKNLVAAPTKLDSARPASDAIYEICCETPALHWLVKPELKWLQRVGAIAAYAVPVGAGVVAELKERRAAAETAPEAPEQPQERKAPPEDMAAVA